MLGRYGVLTMRKLNHKEWMAVWFIFLLGAAVGAWLGALWAIAVAIILEDVIVAVR